MSDATEPLDLLRRVFGHADFHGAQHEIVEHVVSMYGEMADLAPAAQQCCVARRLRAQRELKVLTIGASVAAFGQTISEKVRVALSREGPGGVDVLDLVGACQVTPQRVQVIDLCLDVGGHDVIGTKHPLGPRIDYRECRLEQAR